jgi:hypothetical protein
MVRSLIHLREDVIKLRKVDLDFHVTETVL